jgi:hypothetical protein
MINGGCLCGAVRYTARGAPIVARICWCRVCQKIGAGSGTVNVGFHAADVTIEGVLTDYVSAAESGTIMHRGFCAVCGTPMTSQAETRRHQIFFRAGTLDDPEIAKPGATIWVSEAPSWACISEILPRVERQPPPAG